MDSDSQQRWDGFVRHVGANKSSFSSGFGIYRRTTDIITGRFEGSGELSKDSLQTFEETGAQKEEFIYLMAELSLRIVRCHQNLEHKK